MSSSFRRAQELVARNLHRRHAPTTSSQEPVVHAWFHGTRWRWNPRLRTWSEVVPRTWRPRDGRADGARPRDA